MSMSIEYILLWTYLHYMFFWYRISNPPPKLGPSKKDERRQESIQKRELVQKEEKDKKEAEKKKVQKRNIKYYLA